MVSSMRTCHCHSSGDGSPKCESRGGRRKEGRKEGSIPACHCSAAAAAALKPPFHPPSGRYSSNDPARTTAVVKVNGCLGLSSSALLMGRVCAAAGAERMRVPLRMDASDNGASRGNLATSVMLANRVHGQC